MTIYEELITRVAKGENFVINFEKGTLKIGNEYLIKDGNYLPRDLGISELPDFTKGVRVDKRVELCRILHNLENLFNIYYHSVPIKVKRSSNKSYFKALPLDKLTDQDLMQPVNRELARAGLEGYMLIAILKGCLYWDEHLMGSWFWQSEKYKDLVILREWLEDSKNCIDKKIQNEQINSEQFKNGQPKQTKEQKQAEMLKQAGIDITNFFMFYSLQNNFSEGDDHLDQNGQGYDSSAQQEKEGDSSAQNGQGYDYLVQQSEEYDSLAQQIKKDGFISNNSLFRRWVMAQMFRMIRYETTLEEFMDGKNGFNTYLKVNYNYDYQFSVIHKELETLNKFLNRGSLSSQEFNLRRLFFTQQVIYDTCCHYAKHLKRQLKKVVCEDYPDDAFYYYQGEYVRAYQFRERILNAVKISLTRMENFSKKDSFHEFYNEFYLFTINFVNRYKLDNKTPKCDSWITAYKSAGAFYTLANLILSHGWFIYISNKPVYGEQAMSYVIGLLYQYSRENKMWKMFYFLIEVIRENYDTQFKNKETRMGVWLPIK